MLNIGVIGLGRIFKRVMTDRYNLVGCKFNAVAARDINKAQQMAKEYDIPYAFGSYEEMVKSDKVDMVYIATPHNFHLNQVKLCVENKKHVIIEKPMGLNADEAKKMVAMAHENGVFIMEAMWTKVMPGIKTLRNDMQKGKYGQLLSITTSFASRCPIDVNDRIYSMDLAGGALMDLGVYTIGMANYMSLGKPVTVKSLVRKAQTGCDGAAQAIIMYDNGVMSYSFSAIDTPTPSLMVLYFDRCRIEIKEYWHCEGYTVIWNDGHQEEIKYKKETEGHCHQFSHAAEMINAGKLESDIITLEDTINTLDILASIRHENGIYYPEEKI